MAAGDGAGPGSRVAGYLIEERVARGGMAVVFRARDERLGRVVALKVLAPVLAEDAEFRERFIRESRAAAAVDDPHIIPVFEAGEADGVLFIAMRYVAGGDVRSLLRRAGPLPAWRAAAIVSPVASALDAAHAAGLVHRDVKPANMLVDTRPGRPDHIYLSDFGLSKGALSSVGLTGSGLFLGTPDYISPEQIAGRAVDGRADQYSLACTAFELLTGTPPFSRDHGMAVIYAHTSEAPPLLTSRRPEWPPEADAVLAKGMAKDPAHRHPSCQEFADSLRAALGLAAYETHLVTGDREAAHGERTSTAVVAAPSPRPSLAEADTRTVSPRPQASPPDGSPEPALGEQTEPSRIPGGESPHQAEDGRPGSGPDDQAATAAGHSRRPRRRVRTAAISGGCLVLAAAIVVPILATRPAPPTMPRASRSAPPRTLAASHSAPAATSPQSPTGSPSPTVRYVITSQKAPLVGDGNLASIAAVPGTRSAWAVGWNLPSQTPMIYHWDGTTWSQSASPSQPSDTILTAVAAASATDAWAVGFYGPGAVIDHWDGTTWTQVPAPQPPPESSLNGVTAPSATSAWAVGYTYNSSGGDNHCLIEHWDGTSWTLAPTRPGGSLYAVTATSPANAWAVGTTATSPGGDEPLIEHWDGTAWTQVPTPSTAFGTLYAVTATSPANAWAVGNGGLILHWDGTAWNQVPDPTTTNGLTGVTSASSASAWAVGNSGLILHWDGTAWRQVGAANAELTGVAATSPSSAWVVGGTGAPFANSTQTVLMRWNDTARR